MAQRRRKESHVSDTWPAREKEIILNLFSTAPGPHLSLFRSNTDHLSTTAYIVPDDFLTGSYLEVVEKMTASKHDRDVAFASWIRSNAYPIPTICFEVKGSSSVEAYQAKSQPKFTFGLLKINAIREWKRLEPYQHAWCPLVWGATGCVPPNWVTHISEQVKEKELRADFTTLKNLGNNILRCTKS